MSQSSRSWGALGVIRLGYYGWTVCQSPKSSLFENIVEILISKSKTNTELEPVLSYPDFDTSAHIVYRKKKK